MSESVMFIFKTLIKVPILIFTAFFVMNCFAFMFIYFKVLGFSYVLMQEAVENNYIAPRQANQIADYLVKLQDEIPMCKNATIIVGVDGGNNPVLWNASTSGTANLNDIWTGHRIGNKVYGAYVNGSNAGKREQYGKAKTVGVHCEYEFIWPLSYQYTNGGNVDGYNGTINNNVHTSAETGGTAYNSNLDPYSLNNLGDFSTSAGKATNENGVKGVIIPIDIYYTVPGLKYYADL